MGLARLVLHTPITAVILLEFRNLLLRDRRLFFCRLAPLSRFAKLLHALPAAALANSRHALPIVAPCHATVKLPCDPPAAVLANPVSALFAPPRRLHQENNLQGLTIAVIPLPARPHGRRSVR